MVAKNDTRQRSVIRGLSILINGAGMCLFILLSVMVALHGDRSFRDIFFTVSFAGLAPLIPQDRALQRGQAGGAAAPRRQARGTARALTAPHMPSFPNAPRLKAAARAQLCYMAAS
jgi:hypothetical protein